MGASLVDAATQSVSYDSEGNVAAIVSNGSNVAPSIVSPPVSRLAKTGDTLSFSVVAAGTAPLSYQWLFNGNPISTAANPSAGTATLVLNPVASSDFGSYSAVVTNTAGNATSASATLKLDSIGDGIPDEWRVANFGPNWNDANHLYQTLASADYDGDGITNYEEYLDGTDPNNANSHFYRLTTVGSVIAQPTASRYAPGAIVTLTAQTEGSQQFSNWSVLDLSNSNATAVTSATNPLVLTMTTNYSVTAVYSPQPLVTAASGNLPPSFTQNNHDARVESFLLQADGKVVIGGNFNSVAGDERIGLARFNSDGSLDPNFKPSVNDTVESMVQQSDGKLLIAGRFNTVNGVSHPGIARLNADGSLDPSFATAFNSYVTQIIYRASDGGILVAGNFNQVNGVTASGIALLHADGSLDTSFAGNTGSGANDTVWGMAWQPSGKAVLVGSFTQFNGIPASHIVRLNSNGSPDNSFIATADDITTQVSLRSDGDLYVAGRFSSINGNTRRGFARLSGADGSFSSTVNLGSGLSTGSSISTGGLVVQADGKAIIAGNFTSFNTTNQASIARVNGDGTLDTSYSLGTGSGVGFDSQIIRVALDANGNTLVGGTFNFINGLPHLGMARLKGSDGTLDAAFATHVSYYSQVLSLAAQPSGAVLVGGFFNVVNGAYHPYLARLNADSSLDTTFSAGAGPNNFVSSIAAAPDGRIVVGGSFSTVNGIAQIGVARFNADGTLDPSFHVTGSTDAGVYAVAVQRDGKVIAGGDFSVFSNVARAHLVRLNTDGSVDGSFFPSVNARVFTLGVQPDTKILAGGSFTYLNGVATGGLVRLNADGTTDDGFYLQNPNGLVRALTLQPDGKVLFGGDFTLLFGSNMLALHLARLNADGTVDANFHLGSGYGFDGSIFATGVQASGRLLALGNYGTVDNVSVGVTGLPRLNADGSIDSANGYLQGGSLDNPAYTVAVLADDSFVIGGPFTHIGGQTRLAFARYATHSPSLVAGTVTASPAGPTFPSGAGVTLSVSPTTSGASITSVAFEISTDGYHFQPFGFGTTSNGSTWNSPVTSLPPGASYFRAAVTDASAQLAYSNAAGPFTTPPVVISIAIATGNAGEPFSFFAMATNPLTDFSATSLPSWATAHFDANLGGLVITGTPTAPAVTTAILQPANLAGSANAALTITINNRYASWAGSYFTASEMNNPNISGLSADPTGLGYSNLLRYALHIPAKQTNISALLPVSGLQMINGLRYLTLTYRHDKYASDVVCTVQVANDLSGTWYSGVGQTVELSRTDNGDGTETVVTRDVVPVTSASERFMRLQVTSP